MHFLLSCVFLICLIFLLINKTCTTDSLQCYHFDSEAKCEIHFCSMYEIRLSRPTAWGVVCIYTSMKPDEEVFLRSEKTRERTSHRDQNLVPARTRYWVVHTKGLIA